ncbi:hypothetical protein BKA62DRAFT_637553 [Auriculariales sp. MPI-PUGE-AT-0066]|nr:hypothetical protein BKA62DRAFT_637553 [Auriculariales sp. MPI-PUGE-AT-0066]
MVSLFSRSKSSSAVATASGSGSKNGHIDEFGRVDSRDSTKNRAATLSAVSAAARLRTLSSPAPTSRDSPLPDEPLLPPEGSFLPLSLSPADHGDHHEPPADYGYLFYEKEIVLGIDDVARIAHVVGAELALRGLTTPLLFSGLALDVSLPFIKRIISSFLRTCPSQTASHEAHARWQEEARVASPNDLAMTLRWALARVVRVERGQEARGCLRLDDYIRWRTAESHARYPQNHFEVFTYHIEHPDARALVDSLFTLLSRLVANSKASGLTPPAVGALFGPLLFGLGPPNSPFAITYGAFLRSAHATEHLLLAYIRQTPSPPPRLADWVRGYPAMLPTMAQLDQARRGARTVRVLAIRRNVRMYASDIVKTGATWQFPPTSTEWAKVTAADSRPPRYSDSFRKRLNMASGAVPDNPDRIVRQSEDAGGNEAAAAIESDRYGSLADLKWGEFETLGFGTPDAAKLQFDLTEGARKARMEKRSTLGWNDFMNDGFSRSNAPLSASLQFNQPLVNSVSSLSAQQAELHRKLKKAQKALPSFGWDTKPVLGQDEVIEELFIEVFCDLIWSAGWQDRREQTFRDCNWALVEYKALPSNYRNNGYTGGVADPRTASQLVLYEEFVPSEYRAQLTAPKRRLRLPFTGSRGSSSKWKPATTLNGRPYAIGSVPKSPSQRELEFESMLAGAPTRIISMSDNKPKRPASPPLPPVPKVPQSTQITLPDKPVPVETTNSLFAKTALTGSRFRVGRRNNTQMIPSQYDTLDFETREMLDDESTTSLSRPERRKSRDDAWVDILVASGSRRMAGQDAELPPPSTSSRRRAALLGGVRGNRSDPELAREEVERVLAAAGKRPSDDMDAPAREPEDDARRYGLPEPAPVAPVASVHADTDDDASAHVYADPVLPQSQQGHHERIESADGDFEPVDEDGQSRRENEPDEERERRASVYSEAESVESTLVPPPSLVPESGRQSPARYVHGQPLHNVVEEEEE